MPQPNKAFQAVLKSVLHSQKVNSVSTGAALTYYQALIASDHRGVLPGSPMVFACTVLPARVANGSVAVADVEGWMRELEGAGLLGRFAVDGQAWVCLVGYFENIRKDRKEPASVYPSPESGTQVEPSGDSSGFHTPTPTSTSTSTSTSTATATPEGVTKRKRRTRQGELCLAINEADESLTPPGVVEVLSLFIDQAQAAGKQLVAASTWSACLRKLGGDAAWARSAAEHATLKGWATVNPADWQKPTQGRTGRPANRQAEGLALLDKIINDGTQRTIDTEGTTL